MAKRNRGSNRPGQRHQDRHSSSRQQPRPATRPSQSLSAAEEARAADLESQIVAQGRTTGPAAERSRDRSRVPDFGPAGRPRGQSPLAVRAAEEYGYVSRDVRRIVRVGGTMVGILAVFVVLIDVLRIIQL